MGVMAEGCERGGVMACISYCLVLTRLLPAITVTSQRLSTEAVRAPFQLQCPNLLGQSSVLEESNRLSGSESNDSAMKCPGKDENRLKVSIQGSDGVESNRKLDNLTIIKKIFSENFKSINTMDNEKNSPGYLNSKVPPTKGESFSRVISGKGSQHKIQGSSENYMSSNSCRHWDDPKREAQEDSFAVLDSSLQNSIEETSDSSAPIPASSSSMKPKVHPGPMCERANSAPQVFDTERMIKSLLSHHKGQAESPSPKVDTSPALDSKKDSALSVCIKDLSCNVGVDRIKVLLSRYGEIASVSAKPGDNGMFTCLVEFKSENAKENALVDQWLYIDGHKFPIKRLDAPLTTVVRIINARSGTTAAEVVAACQRCGKVDYIKCRENGAFYVYFKSEELPNMSMILTWLNGFTLKGNRLRAFPAPFVHPDAKEDVLSTKEGREWQLRQEKSLLESIDHVHNRLTIGYQDLQELLSILEKDGSPPINGFN